MTYSTKIDGIKREKTLEIFFEDKFRVIKSFKHSEIDFAEAELRRYKNMPEEYFRNEFPEMFL